MRLFFVITIFFAAKAQAFLPDLGHLLRHQPMMLKANPQSFTVDGSIEIQGEKVPYKLRWVSAKEGYVVEFKKLPSAWTTSQVNELILYREGSSCMLVINNAANPCSALRFWGDFEFNSNGDRAAQTVTALGIASASDTVFRAVNSKDYAEGAKKNSKVKAVLKNIQGTFMSVLEYANSSGASISFDSVTYAPLAAKFPVDGMMWDFVGSPKFFLEKEENKNNLIVSGRIEVREGERLVAVVKREPLKRASGLKLPSLPSGRASVSDVPYARFSDRGRDFLKVLFLTH